ncbi:MAG TPA: hypothetical protein VN674_03880 [Gemmatimonadales bacterium]|nr:hypothetical protein [Gemmatimonadales bacterium]
MSRLQFTVVALALAAVATPTLRAQDPQPTEGVRFGVGGGFLIPTGDYGKVDKTGWHVLGLIQLPISGSPIHLRFDGIYGSTTHQSAFGSGKTTVAGGTADLLFHLGSRGSAVRPYLLGGVGLFHVSSESKFGYGLGGGFLFGVGTTHAFLEARYMSVQTSGSSLTFVPITAGLMFGE